MNTMNDPEIEAWNNFVMNSDPHAQNVGRLFRDAAIANLFCNLSNSGGLCSFLDCTYEFAASDILAALKRIGASIAAKQLQSILDGMKVQLPASTKDERWKLLDQHWGDELNPLETLTREADEQLIIVLQQHVVENKEYYLALD